MDAQQIIDRLAATYANASTYSDKCVVRQYREPREFAVYFAAPSRLRFEYADTDRWVDKPGGTYKKPVPGQSVIWFDGNKTFSKAFYQEQTVEKESLQAALWMVDRNSPLNELHTTALLIAPKTRGSLLTMQSMARSADEVIDGIDCFRVTGSILSDNDTEVCISTEDFTVRRVRHRTWFLHLTLNRIADDVPDQAKFPFSIHCDFTSTCLNGPIPDSIFAPPNTT